MTDRANTIGALDLGGSIIEDDSILLDSQTPEGAPANTAGALDLGALATRAAGGLGFNPEPRPPTPPLGRVNIGNVSQIKPEPFSPTKGADPSPLSTPLPSPLTLSNPQQQQSVPGDIASRVLPSLRQFEATTGRKISSEVVSGLVSEQLQVSAGNALEERRLQLVQEGMDKDQAFRVANLAVNVDIANKNFEFRALQQEFAALGMERDQAFRLTQQAINDKIAFDSLQVQREGIKAGLSINAQQVAAQAQNARSQGAAGIGSVIGGGIGFIYGGPGGAFVGAAAGGLIGGLFA